MRCYLVRHAQTLWNHENRLQGHSDLPLSPVGLEQAKRLGDYFASRSLSALYTSHLARSLQTAQAIAHQTGLSPVVEPTLAEMHLGVWEGLTPDEVNSRYDGAYQRWCVTPSQVEIPGAEPMDQFHRRARQAAGQILAAHQDDGDVVIVSHGGGIASLFADWLEAEYDQVLRRLVLNNAGISALDCQVTPPCVLWVNATSHLVSVDAPDLPGPQP